MIPGFYRDNRIFHWLRSFGQWLTTPASSIHDPQQRRQARWLSLLLVVWIPLVVYISLIAEWSYDEGFQIPRRDVYLTLATLGLQLLIYVVSRTRYFQWSAVSVIILSSVVTFALALPNGQADDSGLLLYLVVPVLLSSMLLSLRATAILIVLQSAGLWAYALRYGAANVEDRVGFVVFISVLIVLGSRHATQLERERQAQLSKTENRYRTLVGRIPIGIFRTSLAADGEFIMANPAFLQMFGFESEADLTKVKPRDLYVDPDERDRFVERLLAEGQANNVELHLKRKDGTPIWGMVTGRLMRDEDTGAPYCDCSIQDITGRKQAEAALEEGEQRYRHLFEHSLNAFALHEIVTDDNGTPVDYIFLEANRAFEDMTGLRAADVIGRRVTDVLPGTEQTPLIEIYGQVALTGEPTRFEQYFPPLDRHYEIAAFSPRRGQFAVLFSEITARVRAEEALRESEAQYHELFEGVDDVITVHDLEGRILDINEAAVRRLGYSREALLTMSVHDLDEPGEYAAGFQERLRQQLADGRMDGIRGVQIAKDGRRIDIDVNTKMIAYHGQPAVLAVVRDITEYKRAEEALTRSEARYRAIIEDQTELISRWKPDGTRTFVNDAYCRYFGRTREELVGTSFISLIVDEDSQKVRDKIARLTPDHPVEVDVHRSIKPDGTIVWQEWLDRAILDENGQVIEFQSVGRDVTERRQAEEALREQRALAEALGDIAALINSTLDPELVFDRILMNLSRVVPYDLAVIMIVEAGVARIIRYRSQPGYEIDESTHLARRFPVRDVATLRQMAETGIACILSDTQTYPLWVDLPETHWVRSYLGVPISVSGEIIGFINVTSAQPGFFADQHVARLQAFADQAAVAINNAHTYDDLERRVIERTVDLSLRNAVAETLSNTLDMDQMLSGVLRTTVERLGVVGGAIYLLADDEMTLSLAASYGVSAETLQLVTGFVPGGVDQGTIGDTLYVSNGVLPDIPRATGISAVLSVPIWQHGQMLGVITLVHDQPRPWRTEETRMLDAIGRQIGVALVNARLYADAVRSEARIRTILQSAADGLLVFDRDNRLVLMNPAAESLFSFYPLEAGGARQAAALLWEWLQANGAAFDDPGAVEFSLPTVALLPVDRSEYEEQCLLRHQDIDTQRDPHWPCWLQLRGPGETEVRRCPVYERIPRCAIQARSAMVRDADGAMLGTVIALHDVTYYRELDELKGRFVSTVSHELRTPLSVVLLQISTLLKYYDRLSDPQRREMMGEIQQQAHTLRELIEDILELSRFDAKRSMPQKQWFDLVGQCDDLIALLEPSIREKSLALEVSRQLDSTYIRADPQQVMRVLRNLLSNAIKYTPEGGWVSLRLEQGSGEIRLSVSDSGIGIAPEDQLYVFDRFFRSEQASRIASGTGLGLAITKEIVDLHRGRIELHSVLGEGSTFTVHLPICDEP